MGDGLPSLEAAGNGGASLAAHSPPFNPGVQRPSADILLCTVTDERSGGDRRPGRGGEGWGGQARHDS